jgi:tRNA nucleotidyltransferase/poly(A) polymerase
MGKLNSFIKTLKEKPFIESLINDLNGEVYIVGGVVRDLILNKSNKDIDLIVRNISIDKLINQLSEFGRIDIVGKSFGVLKFIDGDGVDYDIALPRKDKPTGEGGHKGFEIQSDKNLSIEDDLIRRDAKINAMAININTGEFIDPLGGLDDIENKQISAANPEAFSDDPLRMLRIIGFASRFGFSIDDETRDMIKANANRIKEIPSERILIEFDKIVKKGNPYVGAYLLKDLGLTSQIFNGDGGLYLGKNWNSVKTMAEFLWFIAHHLVQDIAEYSKNKLKCDIETYKELKAFQQAFQLGDNVDDTTVRTVAHNIYKISPKALQSEILPDSIKRAAQELLTGRYPKDFNELAVKGNDLINKGLKGKEIGDALKSLLINVYADKVRNTREDLLNLLNQRKDDVKEGYDYYNDSESLKWNVNGTEKDINFFVKEYDKWNGGYYGDPSKESVKQFLSDKFRELANDDKLNKNLYWELIDREILNEGVEKPEKVEYGALMLFLDVKNWSKITSVIEKDDIYKVGNEFGIETEPHVTILYGFHKNVDADDVFDLYKENYDLQPIEFEVKGISIFENPDFDVVKLDVESKVLGKMNKLMRDLPSTITYPEYHPHITLAYVKKGSGKKYVKKFEKNRIMTGNKLVFSTKKEKKNSLGLKDKGVLNENQKDKVLYSAVVLDDKSRTALIKVFSLMIPKDWEVIAHHQTINMGAIDNQFKQLLGEEIELNVTGYAMDDKVMAAAVEGGPTTNKIPHVTIAVNRANGGKPVMSNNLTDWKPLGFPLKLTGKINEL